jgi:protein gp37
MNKTVISWTDVTWNPTHGCSHVSEGCRNCYAERISRQKRLTPLPWTERNAIHNVLMKPHKLREPYRLKTPSRVFVNSMSDLFHPQIPDDYIAGVFAVMNDLPEHIFQLLTKRPERAAAWPGPWKPHIWMGTSVEDRHSLYRLQTLRHCPASVRFISFEPLLEPIADDAAFDLTGYQWAIVGGESGPGFRPMPHRWACAIKDQCIASEVAFFFKQSAAYRNEKGVGLQDHDGAFYIWHQFPGQRTSAKRSAAHPFTYDTC